MAGKGSQTPQPVRKASRSGTPPLAAAQNGLAQTPRTLQRSGSLRVRGEAVRPAGQIPLRRERTADSLRPRTARHLRGAPGTPSPEVAKSRGACSLPHSPTPSRRSSSADCSWETQSVLSSSSPFSTDGISRNGTTFSSRHNKYLIHCAKRVDDEHYLTPTQRTTRDLKRLRGLLDKAHETIQQKDAEIHRLKQEVISLRLRASSQGDSADRLTPHHPDPAEPGRPVSDLSGDLDRLGDPDTLLAASTPESSSRGPHDEPPSVDTTDASAQPPTGDGTNHNGPISPHGVEAAVKPLLVPSVGDSGTFDCLTSPSISSKESGGRPAGLELEERFGDDWEATEHWIEWEEKRLREESERRIAELNRQHAAEYQEMKEKYNDKVEGLLQKLTEANGRYFEIRPLYDASRLRVGQLELELEKVRSEAERRAETREISAQTTPDPSRTEMSTTSTQHASVQTSAAPVLVAAQSQTAPAETAGEPAKSAETPKTDTTPAPKADNTWEEVPLNESLQQQHLATRPADAPPATIQVEAMVHSSADRSDAVGVPPAAAPDSDTEEPDWPPELAPPVTQQPQPVASPVSDGPVQFAVPFTRYFAHVASQGPSNPHRHTAAASNGIQAAAPSAGDPTQVSAPTEDDSKVSAPSEDDSVRVNELTQRLSQTETELERVRSLYCQQLALLEDSQRSASSTAGSSEQPASLEMDPPMRLQFLKSAVFHYLTDKDDYVGHMRAISAVLQFSEWEQQEVERVRARKNSHA